MKEKMKKLTLVLIGIGMVIGSNLVSPAMETISQSYPDGSTFLLPMMVTLPALSCIVGMFLSSALNKRISTKPLIIAGLLLFTIGGISPAWLSDLGAIIFFRGIVGIGFGMILPLQMQLFATYPDKERANLIGMNVALNCAVGIVLIMLAGMLAATDWHSMFLLYSVGFILLVMVVLFVENTPPVEAQEQPSATVETSGNGAKMSKTVFIFCAFIAMLTLCVYTIMVVVSSYLLETGLGGLSEASILISIATLMGAVGGVIMPETAELLKSATFVVLVAIVAAGFFLFANPQAFAYLMVGTALINLAYGVFSPWASLKITQAVPLEKVALASSAFMASVFVCQFLSPYFYQGVRFLIGASSMSAVFFAYGIIVAVLAVVSVKAAKDVERDQHEASCDKGIIGGETCEASLAGK